MRLKQHTFKQMIEEEIKREIIKYIELKIKIQNTKTKKQKVLFSAYHLSAFLH